MSEITEQRDTAAGAVRAGYRTLKSAPIFWGKRDLIVELRYQRRIGYNGRTLAAIFDDETEADRVADPFCRVLDILRRDLIGMLCRGEVIASAFAVGSCPSTERLSVYPGRWRILEPNFDANTATGAGIELLDVWVRSPSLVSSAGQVGSFANQPAKKNPAKLGDAEMLVISVNSAQVRKGPNSIRLPGSSFPILKLLAEQAIAGARYTTITQIERLYSAGTEASTIRSYISKCSEKLRDAKILAGDGDDLIQNTRQSGYSLRIAPAAILVEDVGNIPNN